MSRLFSTSARNLVKWLGYSKDNLPDPFMRAAEVYSENGAKKKVGEIESIEIL
ncbi:hypothetical protein JDV02_002850 [Purpureocillium takamizusanense]|uniref:Uncharacterized protein n=1 Tax=Purpureocillium takamizusanense TaxID=2060973 RepID=A0A9Q8QCS3_9HYPO|nr:uncharacterized protein JDV02_002850 [Purpureocillium takamizusanense]UNI16417.1 hypothetical protein JDV02_002850 [Purpureocillium takamizusanense]